MVLPMDTEVISPLKSWSMHCQKRSSSSVFLPIKPTSFNPYGMNFRFSRLSRQQSMYGQQYRKLLSFFLGCLLSIIIASFDDASKFGIREGASVMDSICLLFAGCIRSHLGLPLNLVSHFNTFVSCRFSYQPLRYIWRRRSTVGEQRVNQPIKFSLVLDFDWCADVLSFLFCLRCLIFSPF
jgi:hypothetical protein